MAPAPPGFFAAPSQAEAPIRDCPRAPPNTAMAKPMPAASARYLLTELALSPAALATSGCASTVIPLIRMPTTAKNNILSLFIVPPGDELKDLIELISNRLGCL